MAAALDPGSAVNRQETPLLMDLTRHDWMRALELDQDRMPSVLWLRGTRNLKRHYDGHRALLDDVIDVGSPNGLFEDICIGRRHGVDIAYASVYGAPMASEVTHLFSVLGVELVIQSGVCGGIADGIDAGDLIVATSAGRGDGASDSYLRPTVEASVSSALVTWANGYPCDMPVHVGPIWTTSALLAEGQDDLDSWNDQGFIAVDMETAATFAVANAFNVAAFSVLSVFDNPRHGAHLAMTENDKDDARSRGEASMRRLILALIDEFPSLAKH